GLDMPGVNPVQDIADGGLRLIPDGPGGPGSRGDDERQGGGGHRPGAHRQPDPPVGEATGGGRLAAAKQIHALASWNQYAAGWSTTAIRAFCAIVAGAGRCQNG